MKCMNLSMIMFLSSGLKMQCAKKIPIQGRINQRLFPPTRGREGKVRTYSKIMAYSCNKNDLPSLTNRRLA